VFSINAVVVFISGQMHEAGPRCHWTFMGLHRQTGHQHIW